MSLHPPARRRRHRPIPERRSARRRGAVSRGRRRGGLAPQRTARPWARLGDDRGASPIELAIIGLVMITLTFVVVQAALVYYAQYLALAAATQGADAARGYQADAGAGTDQAQRFLDQAGWGLRAADIDATVSPAGDVRVDVRGQAVAVLPFVTFHIEQSAHRTVEHVTDSP